MTRTRWLFLRLLAGVFLLAFASLWLQMEGLIGSRGILPAADLMKAAVDRIPGRIDLLPTLAWFYSTDRFLHVLCAAGAFVSCLALIGVAESLSFFALWILYLSLTTISGEFLSFQWDNLLLETGFLAVFFAPFSWRPRWSQETRPPAVTLWLLRWLLFRLMFESALVKLTSGDPSWRGLTALQVHFETQPLPTWIGWWAHQVAGSALKAATVGMFVCELAVPFLMFFGRKFRIAGGVLLIGLQIVIALTGNYGFFNLLTIVLCLLLFDDDALAGPVRLVQALRLRFRKRFPDKRIHEPGPRAVRAPRRPRSSKLAFALSIPLAAFVVSVSGSQLLGMVWGGFWDRADLPKFLYKVATVAAPFRTVNRYGLFAVMTTSRPEILVEGSEDGQNWKAYEFKWKPGPPEGRPGFVAPHQPRLDWQMWFAALSPCEHNRWFQRFLSRLLEGSPPVLRLLKENPFPDRPPATIRSLLYDYRFTDAATRARDGTWWRRQEIGVYCPTVSRPVPETQP